jgi:chemotaxis protein histidine kinase CheA
MIAKLPEGSPDWSAAGEIYKVHRPEIESHFGASVAATLDADIQAEDKERFLSNYKALLVLNLERRFTYANQDVKDYSAAKLLLAKAKGTYDVLQPYVSDDATDAVVRTAFDEALAALGNPGLFGVGEEPVDPETFRAKTDFILSKMKPLFRLQSAPAAEPAKPETEAKPTEPAKAATTKPEPAKTEPEKTSAEPEPEQPVESEKPADQAAEATEAASTEETPAEAPTAEANPATAEAVSEPTEVALAEAPAPTQETASASEPAAAPVSNEAAHAPMERQARTNPIVSVVVIGAVAAAAAAGLLYAKKKKLF